MPTEEAGLVEQRTTTDLTCTIPGDPCSGTLGPHAYLHERLVEPCRCHSVRTWDAHTQGIRHQSCKLFSHEPPQHQKCFNLL